MKIALLCSSKAGMEASLGQRPSNDKRDEEEEPPPDMLAECDSDETIDAVGRFFRNDTRSSGSNPTTKPTRRLRD